MFNRILPGFALVVAIGALALVADASEAGAGVVVPLGSDTPGDVNCDNELTPVDPLQLLLGVWLYHEPFGGGRLIGFVVIWSALAVYSLEGLWRTWMVKRGVTEPA